ncbi:hypothetical protein [Acetobacterium malicum]|uniref:hypothetical protein n=1 Tax=Acetobacterium malicum TaxID=52692 RepID=UPI00047D0674|nr:hypothetical protein [Acetobacterium dehalogenans]
MSIITGFNSQKYSDIDQRNYEPITTKANAMIYTKQTVLNITGEGFINIATLTATGTSILTLTIDGVVYTSTNTNTASAVIVGFCDQSFILGTNQTANFTPLFPQNPGTNAVPSIVNEFVKGVTAYDGAVKSIMPLFFYQSLKVDVQSNFNGAGEYYIAGGLLT